MRFFNCKAAWLTTAAAKPISRAPIGLTNPAAGVIATRPATAPVATPTAVGLPRCRVSSTIQPTAAAAAAVLVVIHAKVAKLPATKALPPLKPNQPNHSKPAPIKMNGTLWGGAV